MKVLVICQGAAAAYAGLLLGEQGHQVTLWQQGEFDEVDAIFFFRHVRVLVEQPDLSGFDVVLEDLGPSRLEALNLGYQQIREKMPDAILVSLTPFGLTGPQSGWQATELTVEAAAGLMHCIGYDGEAPLKLPGQAAAMIAGLHGASAALAAYLGVRLGNESFQHIDISMQDTLMHHWTRHVSQYAYSGTRLRRGQRDPAGIPTRHTAKTADGWIFMLALRVPWQDVAAFLGLGQHVTVEEQPWETMLGDFLDAVASKTKYEWFEQAAAMGWTFAPVESPIDLLRNPQTLARDVFNSVKANGKTVSVPALPCQVSE